MPRTRNLQTTNRNVRSLKTLTRPASAVARRFAGRDRTTDSSEPHAIASRKSPSGFRGDADPRLAAVRDENHADGLNLVPPRSLPSNAGPNED
jgi:hypothetical protein